MKTNHAFPLARIFVICAFAALIGCDESGPGGDDWDTVFFGDRGGSTSPGTAIVTGTVSSFETASATYTPCYPMPESTFASVASALSELVLPTAQAATVREGIVIYIEGPASKSTTTASDGSFVFTELPPGTYNLRFEYNGEEVSYRGNSGQIATITLEGDTVVQILNLRISGGSVNIGNIRVYDIVGDQLQERDRDRVDQT